MMIAHLFTDSICCEFPSWQLAEISYNANGIDRSITFLNQFSGKSCSLNDVMYYFELLANFK
jgi:hypothetical protein